MEKFPTPTAEQLAASDCPECELCCAVGLCCPPAAQFVALVGLMHRRTGSAVDECMKYAQAVVDARIAAMAAKA